MKVSPAPGAPSGGSLEVAGRNSYSFLGIERPTPLWILAAVFIILVVVVARWRGIRALLGLLIAGAVILKFMLPSLLAGNSAVPVAVVGSLGIMYLVLYLAHGVSMRTSAALAGTIFGVAATAGIGELAVRAAHLTGVGDENAGILQALVGNISLQGLLTCGIIIAGLGVLNDVTIT
ncbi:YibE/F family protein, partial [Terrabacter terrae]